MHAKNAETQEGYSKSGRYIKSNCNLILIRQTMASWRYRKRVRLMPGVTLNISKSGISTTVGPRGANVNLGKSGAFLNTGIPGTGIFRRDRIGGGNKSTPRNSEQSTYPSNWTSPYAYEEVEKKMPDAYPFENLGSESTKELEKALQMMMEERKDLESDIQDIQNEVTALNNRVLKSKQLLYGYFFKKEENELLEAKTTLQDLKDRLEESKIRLNFENPQTWSKTADIIHHAFQKLRTSSFIWDITSERDLNYIQLKTAAKKEYKRVKTTLDFETLSFVESDFRAMHFINAKGMDIYLYPKLAIVQSHSGKLVVYDYTDFKLTFKRIEFVEEQFHPSDAQLLRMTWQKINANGEPDRRFSDNREVPIYSYGVITFKGLDGFEEAYLFSNAFLAEEFCQTWEVEINQALD